MNSPQVSTSFSSRFSCRKFHAILLLTVLHCLFPVASAGYNLKDNYVGNDFFSGWKWETFDDPTHGRVNYVDMQTAKSKNLSYASGDMFVMRADSTNKVDASSRGRDSVRITSNNAYSDSAVVLELSHMPTGCATWPAFWTVTTGQWPAGGEIDILEGVNDGSVNQATLHTTADCAMTDGRKQTGTSSNNNCAVSGSDNTGCGVQFSKQNTYGKGLNDNKGGWYAMTRSSKDGISVYFWGRNDASVPQDVKSGAKSVDPTNWGEPEAYFPGTSCDMASHFQEHNIVFDLTFCGDWAGATYGSGGCTGSCDDVVNNNPEQFTEAYWEVNAVRVYTP